VHRQRAFTLVELLVVIGIIAVLVGVLLPALQAARRQAAAVKCATQLREIGNAYQMYAMENKGYYPPSQLQTSSSSMKYNVDGVDYPIGTNTTGAYWFTFLAKYVTKSKMGYASGNAGGAVDARNSVFWGCPNWEPIRAGGTTNAPFGNLSPVQLGYGATYWPDASPTRPADRADGYPLLERSSFIQGWLRNPPPTFKGRWWKQKTYGNDGATKALVADSRFWALTSQAAPANGVLPRQPYIQNAVDFNGPNQTYADLYRHGKYPNVVGQQFSNQGGKIAFNILYCDGHVSTASDWREAYRAVRQRFPG